MQLAEQLRAEYGTDSNNWTEEQLRAGITRTQALSTF